MEFSSPLIRGQLRKRSKRFFAEVLLADQRLVIAHCPNTGRMKSCGEAGAEIWLQAHNDPKRKLAYTWELTTVRGGHVGINTLRANHLVAEALHRGVITQLREYPTVQREVAFGSSSRFDFLLTSAAGKAGGIKRCWLEVKNATYLCDDVITFPDAPTLRGTKHLRELSRAVHAGDRAVLLYLVNRPEGRGFQPLRDIDPAYFAAMEEAREAGVEFLAYRTRTVVGKGGAAEGIEVFQEMAFLG